MKKHNQNGSTGFHTVGLMLAELSISFVLIGLAINFTVPTLLVLMSLTIGVLTIVIRVTIRALPTVLGYSDLAVATSKKVAANHSAHSLPKRRLANV